MLMPIADKADWERPAIEFSRFQLVYHSGRRRGQSEKVNVGCLSSSGGVRLMPGSTMLFAA
jgi:hypothetical protein